MNGKLMSTSPRSRTEVLKRRAVAGVATVLLAPLAPALGTPAAAADLCSSLSWPVYEVVNPAAMATLLTPWAKEAIGAATTYGYTESHPQMLGAVSSTTGLTAYNRYYSATYRDFYWSADATPAIGYSLSKLDFYASSVALSCTVPVYEYLNGTHHRYAWTAGDDSALSAGGWTRQKVAFHVIPGTADAPIGSDAVPPPPPAPPAPPPGSDGKFTIAVLPDTQQEMSSSSDRFAQRNNWLIANKAALDLRYTIQVGDLVNWDTADHAQFAKASNGLTLLEQNAMPWTGAIGNHDTGAVCPGGSACPGANTSIAVRNTTTYNSYFPVSRFADQRGQYEAGKVDNSYVTFQAEGLNWMVLNLELWPRQGAIDWAKKVLDANPGYNVIVNTHAYLEGDGSISTYAGGYGATSPKWLFDTLIKTHANVKVVLSGHVGLGAQRTDFNNAGAEVVSYLQCFHSSTNPTRLLEIDTVNGTIGSKVYAPSTNTSYPEYTNTVSGLSWIR